MRIVDGSQRRLLQVSELRIDERLLVALLIAIKPFEVVLAGITSTRCATAIRARSHGAAADATPTALQGGECRCLQQWASLDPAEVDSRAVNTVRQHAQHNPR